MKWDGYRAWKWYMEEGHEAIIEQDKLCDLAWWKKCWTSQLGQVIPLGHLEKRRARLRGDETFPVRDLLRGCFSFGPIFKRKWRNEQLVLSTNCSLSLSLSLLKKVPAVPILGKFCDEFSGSQMHSRVFSHVIQRRDLKTAVCSTETKLIKTIQMIDRKILCCPIKDKFMKDGNRFRKIERFLLADKKQQESIFAYRRLL